MIIAPLCCPLLRRAAILPLFVISLSIKALPQISTQRDPGTISSMVNEAKKSHLNHITLLMPLLHFADPKTPEAAVDNSSVLVAQLMAQATTHNDLFLITWNKFRLIETLHRQPRSLNEDLPPDIPPALLPIEPGEFIIGTFTGSEIIDGVTVSIADPLITELAKSNTYVLFLTFRCDSLASPLFGHNGIFLVDAHGLIKETRISRITS